MSLRDAFAMVGQQGTLTTAEGLTVLVAILDVKQSYGNTRLLVRGDGHASLDVTGKAWVDASRVRVV